MRTVFGASVMRISSFGTLNEIHRGKFAAEDVLGVTAEPAVEKGRVDAAEVGVEDQVAVAELIQPRIFSVEPSLDLCARDDLARGRAVVGPSAGIFVDAAAEFAEDHHRDSVVKPQPAQVLVEGRQ